MTRPFDLHEHTIPLTVSGSRVQGLQSEASDVDLRGVAIPPARYYLGFVDQFEQADAAGDMDGFEGLLTDAERAACAHTKLEGSVYELRKFVRLAADANPNMIEVLFCRDEEVRLCTAAGRRLRAAAPLFLSQKVRHTFAGYAASQLTRIRGHRHWLLHPPTAQPAREEYGLPARTLIPSSQLAAAEAAIRKQMDRWEMDFGSLPASEVKHIQGRIETTLAEIMETTDARWKCAGRTIGLDDNLIEVLDRERRYKSAHREWTQFQSWKRNRNPTRAALEAKHGYDTKHGAHLVRLLRMGREILTTGQVHVWRGDIDTEELQAIRGGAWSYDELVGWAEAEERELGEVVRRGEAAVPKKVPMGEIEALVVDLVREVL